MEYLTSAQFIETVIILVSALVIILLLSSLSAKLLHAKAPNKSSQILIANIFRGLKIIVIFIVILVLLSINGIHVGQYVAGLGLASVVAGFALQAPITDIITGISILVEGYFKIGDIVEYKGELGKVVAFNLKTTWIVKLADDKTLIISNRNITEISKVSDWLDIDVPIGYDVDLHYSRALCRECAKKIERLRYVYSCDFLNTQELAESWIEYRLRIHCLPEKYYTVRRNAIAVIQDVFYEHNCEFPLSIKVIYNNENKNHTDALEVVPSEKQPASQKKAKADYELGRGAEMSKLCKIDGSTKAVVNAVNEAERYAVAENLGNKMKMRIRLLSEEILSLLNIITEINGGEFYVQRDGTDYEICYDADAVISSSAQDTLMSVSTTGTNEAYGGLSGLIKKAVDTMIMREREGSGKSQNSGDELLDSSIIKDDADDLRWSFNKYKEGKNASDDEKEDNAAPSDNFEISVLSRFSDDIKIAVRAKHVNIRILVKNEEP